MQWKFTPSGNHAVASMVLAQLHVAVVWVGRIDAWVVDNGGHDHVHANGFATIDEACVWCVAQYHEILARELAALD